MKTLPEKQKEQLVLAQMDTDPGQHQGVRTTQQKIMFRTSVHLTRDYVSDIIDRSK
jgi:hypothetical protein